MPKGSPSPWFRKSRNSWFVTLHGKQIDLKTADRREAFRRWHQLALAGPAPSVAPPQLSARELIARFLEWSEKHTSPRSYEWYSYFLVEFAQRLPEKLAASDLRPFWVTRWLDQRPGWTANSHRSAISTVKRVFTWGIEQGYFDSSPLAGLKKPAGRRRETILTEEQRQLIIQTASDQCFRDLLILIQETGVRPQEIRIIEARHVDAERRLWVLPPSEHRTGAKTGRSRIVYLTPTAWQITERLVKQYPEGPLFRNQNGNPWTTNSIRNRFRRLRENLAGRVPPDLCAYVFRHTYATDALQRGVDPITLAELMGHRDTTMISRVYQHVTQRLDHMQAAACRATGADISPK